jgi:hypothetical protein
MAILATDAFSGSGDLDGNWTVVSGFNMPQQVSGDAQPFAISATTSIALYTGITWPNNQYAQCIARQANGPGQKYIAIILRGLTSEHTLYEIRANSTGASITVIIYRVNAGSITTGPSTSTAVNAGSTLKGSVVTDGANAIVKLYVNDVEILSWTDTSPLASGSPGIYLHATGGTLDQVRADNWEGGSFGDSVITSLARQHMGFIYG